MIEERLADLEMLQQHQLYQQKFEKSLEGNDPSIKFFYFRFSQYFGRLLRAAELSSAGLKLNPSLTEIGLQNLIPLGDLVINMASTGITLGTGIPMPSLPLFSVLGTVSSALHRRWRGNLYKTAAEHLGQPTANEQFVVCLSMYLCQRTILKLNRRRC